MKRYQRQSDEEFLDSLVGKDVWIKVLSDPSMGYMEPDILWVKLADKAKTHYGHVYDAHYVKVYETVNDVCECSPIEYDMILSTTLRMPCSCLSVYYPVDILTTEEFFRVVDDR